MYAVFCYNAQNNDELSFNINDKMTVLRKGDEQEKEWWWARKAGARDGYIARNLLGVSSIHDLVANLWHSKMKF